MVFISPVLAYQRVWLNQANCITDLKFLPILEKSNVYKMCSPKLVKTPVPCEHIIEVVHL